MSDAKAETKAVVQECSETVNEEPVKEPEIIKGVPVRYDYLYEQETESRAEREVRIAKEWESQADDGEDSMLGYALMCYDAALELHKKLEDQGHSGMSVHVTFNIFKKLVEGKPLSPITGADDEWHAASPRYDQGEVVGYTQQNKRMTSLFKYYDIEMDFVKYNYNDMISITNDGKVWQTYPPTDCAGTLDDEDPRVKKYFDQRQAMRDKHAAEIKLPTSQFPTFYYTWNFETEMLEEAVPFE